MNSFVVDDFEDHSIIYYRKRFIQKIYKLPH